MTTTMPSIAELMQLVQQSHEDANPDTLYKIRNSAPVLLEIAAATKELFSMDVDEDSDDATLEQMMARKRVLLSALAKVRR